MGRKKKTKLMPVIVTKRFDGTWYALPEFRDQRNNKTAGELVGERNGEIMSFGTKEQAVGHLLELFPDDFNVTDSASIEELGQQAFRSPRRFNIAQFDVTELGSPYKSYVICGEDDQTTELDRQEKTISPKTTEHDYKMVTIPPGRFLMGAPGISPPFLKWFFFALWGGFRQRPQHEVTISKPFLLGVRQVTQSQYHNIVGDNPSHCSGNERRPVDHVSWLDAVRFCNRYSEKKELPEFYEIQGETVSIIGGNGFRLPTEAEWEHACRAGTDSTWYFGDDKTELVNHACFWDAFKQEAGPETQPVGKKLPNRFGLYDLYGNVSEWCWDWFGSYTSEPKTDPRGPATGLGRLIRGGSCDSIEARFLTSRTRGFGVGNRLFYGFRMARTVES